MAMSIAPGAGTSVTPRRHGRRMWPAGEVARLAAHAFDLLTRSAPAEEPRCSWCSRRIEPGGDAYCSVECARAVRVGGLYLG